MIKYTDREASRYSEKASNRAGGPFPCQPGPILRKYRGQKGTVLKISNFKTIGKNSLIAAFDLELPSGMTINGAMLMRSGESEWISFPGIPTGEKDGKKTYKPVVSIPNRDRRDKFNEQVLQALVPVRG